jgi:hypothetical protein
MDFISGGLSNGLYFINFLTSFRNKQDKNIIIDPMSCLIKLSILKFYPVGTKISIGDNMLSILDPGLLQGPVRFFKGDGREDLHNLYIPLIKSIEWYWYMDTPINKDIKENKEIKILFDYAINGLEILKSSYPINSTICHTLDLYIHHLSTKQTKTLQNKEITDNKNEENNSSNTNKIHEYLKQLWNQREIHIIIELLLEYDKNIKNNITEKQILISILNLTNAKEIKLKDFLKNHFASL